MSEISAKCVGEETSRLSYSSERLKRSSAFSPSAAAACACCSDGGWDGQR